MSGMGGGGGGSGGGLGGGVPGAMGANVGYNMMDDMDLGNVNVDIVEAIDVEQILGLTDELMANQPPQNY